MLKKDQPEIIEIIGQFSGFKTLSIGGARISIDLYEERPHDYALAIELCRRREVVKLTISPYTAEENKPDGGKENKKEKRKAGASL